MTTIVTEAITAFQNSKFLTELIEVFDPIAIIVTGSTSLGFASNSSDIDIAVLTKVKHNYRGERHFTYLYKDKTQINLFVEDVDYLIENNPTRTGLFSYGFENKIILYLDENYTLDNLLEYKEDILKYSLWVYYKGFKRRIENLLDHGVLTPEVTSNKYYLLLALYFELTEGSYLPYKDIIQRIKDTIYRSISTEDYNFLLDKLEELRDYMLTINFSEEDIDNLKINFENNIKKDGV